MYLRLIDIGIVVVQMKKYFNNSQMCKYMDMKMTLFLHVIIKSKMVMKLSYLVVNLRFDAFIHPVILKVILYTLLNLIYVIKILVNNKAIKFKRSI